jgi:hemolysin III
MLPSATVPAPLKPLLRGWLHLVCFFLAIPAAVLVVAVSTSGRARLGAVVYAVGLVALFGVSGTYHRGRWTDARRRLMQKLDHGTIS